MKSIESHIKDKKILLLGFGREGQSTFRFLKSHGVSEDQIGIADKNEIPSLDFSGHRHFGSDYLDSAYEYDLVFRSPGIPLTDSYAARLGEKLTSQVDCFLRYAPGIHIGITGTKGKSSTSSLLYSLLSQSNKPCQLIGNIGIPVFEGFDSATKDTISVLELSSHQLQFLNVSPRISVILNLHPDHLDHYGTPARYFEAKSRIFTSQTENDLLIHGTEYPELTGRIASAHHARRIPIEGPARFTAPLPLENIIAATLAAETVGLKEDQIRKGFEQFKTLPNRLERIELSGDRVFFNDSAASVPESTISAFKRLNKVDFLICGGMDRGSTYERFIEVIQQYRPTLVVGLPDTGEQIVSSLSCSSINAVYASDLDQAVHLVLEQMAPGTSCLFSPGAPSYHRYRNFEERGEHLRKLLLPHALVA